MTTNEEHIVAESHHVMTDDRVRIHLFDLKSAGHDEILMLHGVGRAGRTFSSLSTMLPGRFRIRAIDFRGHGQSERAGDRYRIADYIEDAIAALDFIGRPTVVYGHSLGSLVAAAVASTRPHLVAGVVLEDPPSPGFWAQLSNTVYYPTFAAMQRWAGRRDVSVQQVSLGFGSEVVKTYSDGRVLRISDVRDAVNLRFAGWSLRQLDPEVMNAILLNRWPMGFDFDDVFRSVPCPALLFRGDVSKGGMLPDEDAAHLSDLVTDLTRIDFPNAGHLLHWQMRSEVAQHTSAWLETLT
ncbi:MAG: alpha/beta fold hydrolase [Planctomycetota bacterium]